jgi:adenosylmethionine-8-amino-7-oxononanoate aminotransferase
LAAASGVAIDNARLQSSLEHVAVLQDRERIARELHDKVIQRLFAAGMTLQTTLPIAARTEVAAVLANAGFMYFTFTGNDAACAASVAVLDIMEREGLVDRVAKMGPIFGDRLHAEFDEHPAVVEVRGRGLFWGIELNIPQTKVVAEALSRDVWIYPAGSGPVPSAVIAPPSSSPTTRSTSWWPRRRPASIET